jgi:hypothetical protein
MKQRSQDPRILGHSKRRPSGAVWTTQQVGRVLDIPAYVACCALDGELVPAQWSPIIPRDLWDQVQDRRRVKATVHRQRRLEKKGPYLLWGLLFCGTCGRKLRHRARRSGSCLRRGSSSRHGLGRWSSRPQLFGVCQVELR